MIDIHCHILPNIDDGSDSLEDSFEMLKLADENGIDVVVATPHFLHYSQLYEFVEDRDEKAKQLNRISSENGCRVVVACGAEVFLDSRVFTADNMDDLTINGSRYMLCEYTLKPFDRDKAIIYAEELIGRGYIPIIAHPERYVTFYNDPEIVNELHDMGCLFQVNASGLAGHGGEKMQDFSLELIKRGFARFVATDAHSPRSRNNKMLEKLAEFPEELSRVELEDLLSNNPLTILKKEKLPEVGVRYF